MTALPTGTCRRFIGIDISEASPSDAHAPAALYAASRILVAICRERLLPPVVAWVWDRTLTPVWCTLITGLICGAP